MNVPYRIEVFKGDGVQPWRFRLVAGNGEIVSQSEGYFSKYNCKRTAKRIAQTMRVEVVEVEA